MVYMIIGIIVLIGVRYYFYNKYLDLEIGINVAHEIAVDLCLIYITFLCNYYSYRVTLMGPAVFGLILLFIPFGFFLPMTFRRMKSLVCMEMTVVVFNVFLCLMQLINCGKTKPLNILFGFLGALIGFIVYAIFSEMLEVMKKGFLVPKKKNKPMYVKLEAEICVMVIIACFVILSVISRVLVENKVISKRGEIVACVQETTTMNGCETVCNM